MIQIVGLAPTYDLLPLRAVRAIEQAEIVVLQSERASAAGEIMQAAKTCVTLDDVFERAQDFKELYESGARKILELAQEKKLVFCVIGDVPTNGFVLELSKTKTAGVEFLCGTYALEDAMLRAAELVGGTDGYAVYDAIALNGAHLDTSRGVVIQGMGDIYTAADVKLKLLEYYRPQTLCTFSLGKETQKMEIGQLDQITDFGDGAFVVLPALALAEKERFGFYDLVEVMQRLRAKDGCPWDREQTHKTLRQYLLEESYEVMDAIDADDMDSLYDELGDVLLQVVFHAEIGRQCGEFDDMDVTTAVSAKMISRHPHIFADGKADTADEVVVNWEAIKREEKGNKTLTSVLKDVPKTMGAMMRAYKIQKKAGAVGFDWASAEDAFLKVREEVEELGEELRRADDDAIEAEAGDLMFALVNVMRKRHINPEVALTRTCEKFIKRFAYIESNANGKLDGMTLDKMDALWEAAKEQS